MKPSAELNTLLDRFHIASQKLNLAPHLVHNQVTANALTREYYAAREAVEALWHQREVEWNDRVLQDTRDLEHLQKRISELEADAARDAASKEIRMAPYPPGHRL